MTTKRCGQCGDEYTYQGSGYGCNRPENDATYCPSCKTVINEALAKIPRRFECRYRDVQEMDKFKDHVTLEMLIEWERADMERRKTELWGQRIWPALYNIETGDSQNTREIVGRPPALGGVPNFNGIRFRLSTWKKNPEVTIEVPMEYDLLENKFTGHAWPH
jgi:hypothetical protein